MRAGWEAVLRRTVSARWHLSRVLKEPDRHLESKCRQSKQVRRPEGPGRDVLGDGSGCIREVRCLAFPSGETETPEGLGQRDWAAGLGSAGSLGLLGSRQRGIGT